METRQVPTSLTKEQKVKTVITLIAIALVALFYFWACGGESKATASEIATDKKIEAFVACQEQVKNNLKSPATADFPFYAEGFAMEKGNDVYIISSYVDSQNDFGAVIRTNFTCKVTLLKDGQYKCEELAFY